jgi:predicted dehydrogenase
MSDVLKIVVVGCGGISDLWFKGVKEVPDIAIVGLVDLYEASALKKKQEHQLAEAHTGTDMAAMFREARPDIVFDCTIPEARATVVEAALRHGCHVLSEKPMAATMTEAHHLLQETKKAKRLFAVMQNRRYDPRIRALRSFLDSGIVGPATTLNGDFYVGPHFGGFRDKMPHVLLLDMAIHSFDQARLISGADPVAVYCHEWNPHGSWYEHDASAIAIFEMTGGVVYTYRGSWCAEGVNTSWECDWRVVGTKGTVTWNGADQIRAQKITGDEGFQRPVADVPILVPEPVTPTGHAGCIQDFIDCVRTGRTPETFCTENIKSLAMVFGAIESAQSGRRVPIPF